MEKQVNLLSSDKVKLKVSSVLSNSKKEFGAEFMIDGKEDTGWSSNQGNSQSIIIEFKSAINLNTFSCFEFVSQGGFCPKNISFIVYIEDFSVLKQKAKSFVLKDFNDIKDTSEIQKSVFNKYDFDNLISEVKKSENNNLSSNLDENQIKIYGILLKMTSFYDLHGRVTFYDIKLF